MRARVHVLVCQGPGSSSPLNWTVYKPASADVVDTWETYEGANEMYGACATPTTCGAGFVGLRMVVAMLVLEVVLKAPVRLFVVGVLI